MGTTALRQLLKSFCYNLPWNYAVLWKLRHEGQMILSWEDGYCDHLKLRGPVSIMSEDIYRNGASELFSAHSETSAGYGGSEGYPIGLVVANMSHLQYALGEGVVGEVANTGNHFWASYDNVSTGKINSKLVLECPDEWQLQLASGIKTFLLVPVLPHGVVQLGSLEPVAEDLAVVSYIKDRFIHNVGRNGVLPILNRDIQTQSSSTLSGLMDSLDEPSASTISQLKSEDSDTVDSVKPSKILLSNLDPIMPLVNNQYALRGSAKDLSGTFRSKSVSKIGVPVIGHSELSNSQSPSAYDNQLEMMESKLFGLSCLEEELLSYSQCNKYNVELLGKFSAKDMSRNFRSESKIGVPSIDLSEVSKSQSPSAYADLLEMMESKLLGLSCLEEEFLSYSQCNEYNLEQQFQDISNNTGHSSSASFLNFPKDCELHKALGSAFQSQTSEYLRDSTLLADNICNSSSLTCTRDLDDGIEPTSSAKGRDAEYLLEAVVASVCKGTDDTSSLTLLENFVNLSAPQSQSKESALAGDDTFSWSNVTSAPLTGDKNGFTPISASFKSKMGTFVDKEQLEKGFDSVQSRKGMKLSNVSKRRIKPGDNQKPRPRDRQLIQDHIKELRELVPNGVKCSIDGLLGRTIEHMLHLRSVADQAEKLKKWVHHEVAARRDLRSSETKDGNKNGTTWAFEVGNELLACPIVVEDLAYPGHMLIEMLCNEDSLFLEIAQVIRSLELTILKGVVESRSNNTWAHFIVEASKGFHRTEIFWPLMHLLQRKRNPISSKI